MKLAARVAGFVIAAWLMWIVGYAVLWAVTHFHASIKLY